VYQQGWPVGPTLKETLKMLMGPISKNLADLSSTTDPLKEPLETLSLELSRISAEIQSISSGFQAHIQLAVAESGAVMENHYRAQMEKSLAELREQLASQIRQELRKEFEAELQGRLSHLAEVQHEITRVTATLDTVASEIASMLDDPTVDLSHVMRKRNEQAVLKSYLDGLRCALGEKPKAKGAGV
jgi:ABC-type transporter Mla subunit MlaD